MVKQLEVPEWAEYLFTLGRALAELPNVEFGEPSPRVILSVPTGRYTYWMLAAGALSVTPRLDDDFQDGEIVTTWLNQPFRIADIELQSNGSAWQIGPQDQRLKTHLKAVRVPPDAPDERRGTRMTQDDRDALRALDDRGKGNWYLDYVPQCLRPVVIVGKGRDHIQDQRRVLLEEAPHWFRDDTRQLLERTTGDVSEGNQMLFHPFMILDEHVGSRRPWIRSLTPRLTVVTSWSSHESMAKSLFSRRPRVIVANRRVKASSEIFAALRDLPKDSQLQTLVDIEKPPGIDAFSFLSPAQSPSQTDEEDVDDWEDLL